jgi:hypothetical protein
VDFCLISRDVLLVTADRCTGCRCRLYSNKGCAAPFSGGWQSCKNQEKDMKKEILATIAQGTLSGTEEEGMMTFY